MNPEEGKLLCKMYLDTIQQEAETTKKVIRAIPDDQMSYKPDPKSKNAHELAWHIASSEVWFLDSIIAGSFSMGEPPAPPPPTISGIIEWYDSNQKDRVNKLKNLPGRGVFEYVYSARSASSRPVVDVSPADGLESPGHLWWKRGRADEHVSSGERKT